MKTINHLNRRDFLGLVAGSSLLINNANEFMAQPPQNRIRRNIAMIDNPNLYSIAEVDAVKRDVEALKKAVDDMKHKYSETDFRHWKNQAGIHTNWCPHQNWFFLPWHRAYLDYFEQICRKISGYDDFMIPYWDWSISRKIPSVFLEAGSPLLETDRKFILQEATNALVGETMVNSILKKKDFKTFSGKPVQNQRETGEGSGTGSLERVHNHIHSGYIGGLMRIPATAAFDPVFWVHHSNVDRLWEIWLRTHKEVTKDTDWLDFPLGNFFDPNGTPVKKKVRDLLYISKLGYTYPNLPEEAEIKFAIQNINIPNGLTVFRGGNQKSNINESVTDMVPTKISNTFQTSIEQISRTQITNKPFPPIVRLTVEIEIIGTLSEVLIFINAINTSEFSIDDPAFIGAATFFGGNHNGEHNHQPGMTMEGRSQSFYFDVTETIQKLSQADRFTNLKGASVTVAPVIPEDNSLGITGEIKLKSFKFEIVY